MDIASPITAVKGIGEKTQKAFAKMGVYTVGDGTLWTTANEK